MWTRISYDAVHDWIDETKREAVKAALRADGLDDVIARLESALNMGVWYQITNEAAAAVGEGVVAESVAVAERELSAAAAALGRKGGSVKGGQKAEASRENGKKGGQPPLSIDDRLRRDVLKAEARGEARVDMVNTPDGRRLERITASVLVPASIDRAQRGLETGWTIGDWSIYR